MEHLEASRGSILNELAPERLCDRQYIVVLLRMLVDPGGHIVYGDAGGPEEHDSNVERWVHFHGPDGLLQAVQAWLATRREGEDTTAGASA